MRTRLGGTVGRINRFFTEKGLCSRREADKLVEQGRVGINGRIAVHGDQIQSGDVVTLDGKAVGQEQPKPVILAYNKPVGVECTSDMRKKNNIIDAVAYPERVFHIGRLDQMSEGLILLTNQGDIVNKILRGRYGHEKEYIVDFDAPVSEAAARRLARGVDIGDERGPTKECIAELQGPSRLRIVLTEGRNRQIRRMAEAIDNRVKRLKRIRILNIRLGHLKTGQFRHLTDREERELFERLDNAVATNFGET